MNDVKKPTMKDLAVAAEASLGTVSKVLNGNPNVSPELRARVLEASNRLGYQHNMVAAGLRRQSTRTVGIVVPDLRNTFFAEVIEHFELAAAAAGYSVLMVTTGEDPRRAEERVRALVERRVDGVAIIPTLETKVQPGAVTGLSLPLVIIDRIEPHYDCATVGTDGEEAVYKAAHYLSTIGHRKILFAVNSLEPSNTRERIAGFRRAMADFEIGEAEVMIAGVTAEDAHMALREVLETRQHTALLTGSNPVTIGALKAVNELKIAVPHALSLLAFDDFEWLTLSTPAVSAIRQPSTAVGREAWRQLQGQIDDQPAQRRHARFPAELILRESTAPPITI